MSAELNKSIPICGVDDWNPEGQDDFELDTSVSMIFTDNNVSSLLSSTSSDDFSPNENIQSKRFRNDWFMRPDFELNVKQLEDDCKLVLETVKAREAEEAQGIVRSRLPPNSPYNLGLIKRPSEIFRNKDKT